MNRNERVKLAQQTLQIIEEGRYTTSTNTTVDIQELMSRCIEETVFYSPEMLDALLEVERSTGTDVMPIEVVSETTLNGARRLVAEEKYTRVGVLNFASARNPGGGFLGGSQAQEESLARSSGLYASLQR